LYKWTHENKTTASEPLPATIERSGAALSFRIFSSIQETLETKHEGTPMTGAMLKHYGWGREGEGMSAEERKFVLGRYRVKFATDEFDTIAVPGLDDLSLREPRVVPPTSLAPARPL
jgi:alkyldihydroxyacetonephosphate synthase